MRPYRPLVLLLAAGCAVDGSDYSPIADAGEDVVLSPGETATLSGRDSYDPEDGDVSSYSWVLISAPEDSTAELTEPESASPTLTPDTEGTWVIGLTVTDSDGNSSDLDVVSVHAMGGNDRPVAVIGSEGLAQVDRELIILGADSYDPDGDELTYAFEVVVAPNVSETLIASDGDSATFTPDVPGFYVIGLTVSDGQTESARTDLGFVAEPFSNVPPEAICGDDQQVRRGEDVTLDGTGSFDADGDALSYSWTLPVVPGGSAAVLDDAAAAMPTFLADAVGEYRAELRVNDGYADSGICQVTVVAVENNPPQADAGEDTFASEGEDVELDGSGSFDPDGDPLTYQWDVLSTPGGSAALPADPTAEITEITVDMPGDYELQLTVDDGLTSDLDTVIITVEEGNAAPIADAGSDVFVAVGDTASLDGTGSSDPDGDPLTYSWTFTSMPSGSAITDADLVGASSATPSFDPDVAGDYELELTVDDGVASDSDSVVVTATDGGNTPPIADAGVDQSVGEGETVELDASGSSDPDGDPITYLWTFSSVPSGSSLTDADLSDVAASNPTFEPDVAGEYELFLTVSDGTDFDTDEVLVTVVAGNTPPVADAGSDITASTGDTVDLDGTGSSDADGDPLTYTWTFTSVPSGSSMTDADLSSTTSATPSFTPDIAGEYELTLTVSDGTSSNSDSVIVTITGGNTDPIADAGDDETYTLGEEVTLDGSGSSDADGDSLDYWWKFTSVPSGSSIGNTAIGDRTSDVTSFTPDVVGSYTVQLRVYDGTVYVYDTVTFTIEPGDTETDTEVTDTEVSDTETDTEITNTPPEADAGADQTVTLGDTALLDGTGSSDADGDALDFWWKFVSVPASSSIGNRDISDRTAEEPEFTPDVEGDYTLQLRVYDGTDYAYDTVVITVELGDTDTDTEVSDTDTETDTEITNTPPEADAGADQTVTLGDLVLLDGTGSSDADGDALDYWWKFTSVPASSSIGNRSLSDRTAEEPDFTPDVEGEYTLQLRVYDGTDYAYDTVVITVEAGDTEVSDTDTETDTEVTNTPPEADAGADATYDLGDTVTLDGSGSSDADGDALDYWWKIVSVPSTSSIGNRDIGDRTADITEFTPDVAGSYTLQLRVYDGTDYAFDTVEFTVVAGNSAPDADAGDDVTLCGAETVTLDGSGSSDPDGDSLSYEWTFSSVPSGSTLTNLDISDADTDAPSFTPDVTGTFTLQLVVDDGSELDTDTVQVVVDSGDVVLALHLDEESGSTAYDGSGNGYDGTITGTGDWIGARFFAGLEFDGATDIQISDEDDLDLDTDWTIEWWMKTGDDASSYAYQAIVLKGTSTYNYSVWRYSYAGVDYLYIYGLTTSGSYSTIYTEVDGIGDEQWHHYALTHNGSRMALYEDGSLVDSVTTSTLRTNSDDLFIGTYPTSSSYDFEGAIDEFMIHEAALSATEVADRYAASTQWCTGDEDTDGPDVEITSPTDGSSADNAFVAVYGTCDDESAVVAASVNGEDAIDLAGDWSEWVAFVSVEDGANDIDATCEDIAGNIGSDSVSVDYTEELCYDSTWDVIWTLDADDGSDAIDLTGNTSDATAYNLDWLIGVNGNAGRFDGSSSYIQAPNSTAFELYDSFTIDMWVRRDGNTSSYEVLVSKADSGWGAYTAAIYGSTLYWGATNEDGDSTTVSYAGITDGDWHHVAGTYDGSTLTLYIDGVEEDSASISSPLIDENNRAWAGAYYYGYYYHLEGDLDQVRFTSDVLSASEIADLATEGETCLPSENFALSGTATANSELSSTYPGDNVIDDDYDEESLSASATNAWLLANFSGGYVDVELDAPVGITMVRWANTHNGAQANRATTSYTVYASATGLFEGEEVELESGSGELEDTLAWHTIELSEPVAATVLRFVAEDYDSRGAGINEIQIYGVE